MDPELVAELSELDGRINVLPTVPGIKADQLKDIESMRSEITRLIETYTSQLERLNSDLKSEVHKRITTIKAKAEQIQKTA